MIGITIIIIYLIGLFLMLLCEQHRYLHPFEIVGFSFGLGLSLVVFELTLQGVFLERLSIYPSLFTLLVLFAIVIFKAMQKTGFLSRILDSVREGLCLIRQGFRQQKRRQRFLSVLCLLYLISKLFMAFSLNVSHPTMSEDAVNSWDMKTKVFFENRSLVLDVDDPEFFGGAPTRNNYAPLADLFFILLYREFPVGLSNIISPLLYLNLCLVLFGLVLRRSNLNFALLAVYIFLSLPLVFIHSFTCYFNLPTGYYLFCFVVYLTDQILHLEEPFHKAMIFPLAIFMFLCAGLRSENLYLIPLIIGGEILVLWVMGRGSDRLKKSLSSLFLMMIPAVVYLFEAYFKSLDPSVAGHLGKMENILGVLLRNIKNPNILWAPFEHLLFHPDYNILFFVFILAVGGIVFNFRRMKNIFPMFFALMVLAVVFVVALYAFPELLGLLTHYSLRYMLALSPFVIYVVVMVASNLSFGNSDHSRGAS